MEVHLALDYGVTLVLELRPMRTYGLDDAADEHTNEGQTGTGPGRL